MGHRHPLDEGQQRLDFGLVEHLGDARRQRLPEGTRIIHGGEQDKRPVRIGRQQAHLAAQRKAFHVAQVVGGADELD